MHFLTQVDPSFVSEKIGVPVLHGPQVSLLKSAPQYLSAAVEQDYIPSAVQNVAGTQSSRLSGVQKVRASSV